MFAEVLRNDDGGEVVKMSVCCKPYRNVVDDSDGADKHVKKSFFAARRIEGVDLRTYELKMRTRTAHDEANIEGIFNFTIPVTGLCDGEMSDA